MEKIQQLQEIIDTSERIVFFTGAGASTESNIPDFRSVDGLYNQKYKYPPETILSATFFEHKTEEFYEFYRDKMIYENARPNKGHRFMADLEKCGKEVTVITQNIDGLHQMAGSGNVIELHGSVYRNYCTRCNKFYGAETILKSQGIPRCTCKGIIKPDVVLYEEGLDASNISRAIQAIRNADAMIICGTSLTVYPAAGMVRYFNGQNLVIINKSATDYDRSADLCIQDSIGEVLSQIKIK